MGEQPKRTKSGAKQNNSSDSNNNNPTNHNDNSSYSNDSIMNTKTSKTKNFLQYLKLEYKKPLAKPDLSDLTTLEHKIGNTLQLIPSMHKDTGWSFMDDDDDNAQKEDIG